MTEHLIVRDFEDKHTEGYMAITHHLSKIRCLCLPDTQPTDGSSGRVLSTIEELLTKTESVLTRFEPTFTANEQETIRAYIQQVKNKIEHWVNQQNVSLSTLLEEIYHCSTELRVSLGTFRMTIYVSQSPSLEI